MKKRSRTLAATLLLALAASGVFAQRSNPQPFSADAAAERIPNLDTLKAEVKQYHDCTCKCGCYARDLDRQADRAIALLRRRAALRRPSEKLALVLDIDETALSNYEELLGADFAYNRDVWDAWVKSARAPAIAGTLRLFKEAQRQNVSIFFITGRYEVEREATERNLREQGFDGWRQLSMLPAEQNSQTSGEFKAQIRGRIAAQGYVLMLNVGDQWSDLKGKPEAEFSVKYPDPYYFVQ